jgi:hypothetical protein
MVPACNRWIKGEAVTCLMHIADEKNMVVIAIFLKSG